MVYSTKLLGKIIMNKIDLEKALEIELKNANDQVLHFQNEINKAKNNLDYWTRQAESLMTVHTRISIENSKK